MRPRIVDLVPTISTCHMPSYDAPEQAELYAAKYEHGYFVWTDAELSAEEFPEWYINLVKWAKANKYPWVRLDCDAEVIDELQKWEW